MEIERKFLVTGDAWKNDSGIEYHQGYLSQNPDRTVRVRIAGDKGYLTIKGRTNWLSREEFEYEIPYDDADNLLILCVSPLIKKTRYVVHHAGHKWEVDVFHGDNEGLVLAEIELKAEDETFELPPWIGEEVSHDERYYNSNLSERPFNSW